MTDNTIISRFAKCGDLHCLSRRFHNLDRPAKEYALGRIKEGVSPDKAIKQAKKEVAK